jgi:translocation and assembly module TamB
MTRRRFVFLISLCMLVVLGLIGVGVGLFFTRSETGQAGLRRAIERQVAAGIHGKLYLGRMSGNFFTGISIDSLELRDDEDSLFIATGPLRLEYDLRDIIDRRLHLRNVDVSRPVVVLRQHLDGSWNFRHVFRKGAPSRPRGPERGFGDFVVIDSTHLRSASFRLTMPWHPDDSLHGARLDSAVRFNLARDDHEIRRVRDGTRSGFTQNYRWTNIYAAVPFMRIADPDSAAKMFMIDTLHAVETVPTFRWRNVAGRVRVLGDSVWMTVPHWDLPGSTGHAEAKITWGSDLPVRYAVRVWGDSVSLRDVAWVYPTLPTTGGGSMVLDIRNEKNLHRLDYAITGMDVRTTKSRIVGDMTFETGGPVLRVHDVRMKADPVDWDLLRTLNGKPFPADWQGKLTGTVTARGGPLTNFMVDDADVTFRDAHVPGAVSHFTGRGELDILQPAFTAFHRFFASTDRLDLRSITTIYPNFPRIGGIVTGSAVLDSSWLDVRVSNAQLTHTDGPDAPTHATGGGRITYGEKFMSYDLDLQMAPLSLTTLARSYPMLPLRGTYSGPLTVQGMAPDLLVTADLTGAAGHVMYAGHVDADSIGGYGARGSGGFEALDAAALVGRTSPSSRLAGEFDVDLAGDSLANLEGSLALRLSRSELDGVQIGSGSSRLRFERGVLRVDTLVVAATPGTLRASGALGLTRPLSGDSLAIALDVDSLGGLRRYLKSSSPVTITGRPMKPDSLLGTLTFRGAVHGWLDSLAMRGALEGRKLFMNGNIAHQLTGSLTLESVRGHPSGNIELRADTVVAGGLKVRSATFGARVLDKGRAHFDADATMAGGASLLAAGNWFALGDTARITLDTMNLALGDGRWTLQRSSQIVRSPAGVTMDTLVLASANGGRLSGFVHAPNTAGVRMHFRADAVPLADVGHFAQLSSPLEGVLTLDLAATGTRERPTLTLDARVNGVRYDAFSADALTLLGQYGEERAKLQAAVLRNGRSVLDASLDYPIALTLFSARPTGDSLRGRIHADSVDLALVEPLSRKLRSATGWLALDLAVSGQPAQPHVGGVASVHDGGFEIPDAGIRFADMEGLFRVNAENDSLAIEKLRLTSPSSNGSATLSGSVVFRDLANPKVDLRFDAHTLRVVDKRSLARLDVSTGSSGLTLVGTPTEATLSGAMNVDRGTIYIPELVRKDLEELTLDDFAMFFDTTDVRNRSLMPAAPSKLVEHLKLAGVSINLGDDVWLKSKEANVKLGGSLNLTRARDDRDATRAFDRDLLTDSTTTAAKYRLALSGSLSADRGTYLLDLGVVKREFQVTSGRISFFGTPDFNPAIDVAAQYRVKQSNRADILVQARIVGNFFPQPALELTSNDPTIGASDLVSYLATGRPAAELTDTRTASNVQRVSEIVLPTLGASLNQALRDQFGFMDLFQIQSGVLNDQANGTANGGDQGVSSIFKSTRLGGEKQISDRLFLSFSTGLCPALNYGSDDPNNSGLRGLGNSIEGKVEYRFPIEGPGRLSLRAGLDPSASSLRCGATNNLRGFVATPQQWGLSLFRSWSF